MHYTIVLHIFHMQYYGNLSSVKQGILKHSEEKITNFLNDNTACINYYQ